MNIYVSLSPVGVSILEREKAKVSTSKRFRCRRSVHWNNEVIIVVSVITGFEVRACFARVFGYDLGWGMGMGRGDCRFKNLKSAFLQVSHSCSLHAFTWNIEKIWM
jgi:hypothetical protein